MQTTHSFRTMRTVHLMMLFWALLVALIAERIAGEPQDGRIFQIAFYTLAVGNIGVLFFLRRGRRQQAAREFERDPASLQGWSVWRQAQILSWLLAETPVLFGLVLRVMGGTRAAAAPLYAAGLLLLLLLTPRLDPRGRPQL